MPRVVYFAAPPHESTSLPDGITCSLLVGPLLGESVRISLVTAGLAAGAHPALRNVLGR